MKIDINAQAPEVQYKLFEEAPVVVGYEKITFLHISADRNIVAARVL